MPKKPDDNDAPKRGGSKKKDEVVVPQTGDLFDLSEGEGAGGAAGREVTHVDDMYSDWFLDYASYVILERAVPHINDGLKPVQRRILHSMKELEDGRYNKVANIVGNTMKYHPHGDASIGDAMVQLGQKELLIDTQGNWGNVLTGDRAAAPRYIEARLSKFALEVVFNPKTTDWAASYDGRNKEPVTLPVKFPLVLAQGVEGIAVGLSCKILPHNFIELIDASIAALRRQPFEVLPDFRTGGVADFSAYNDGARGGKVRVRAKLETPKRNRIRITEIPFGTTATSLIESILAANDKGKIKVQKVEDNTAENVDILINLPGGTDMEPAVKGLYAFTDCEVSISPNACVIEDNKPKFLTVTEMLRRCAFQTRELLKWELEIRLGELKEKLLFSSLEKIFIENRIYRDIEECETWEAVIEAIALGLYPFREQFYREITTEDIVRLTEIKIKRISKYDSFKADELMKSLEKEIVEVEKNLNNLTRYTVRWFEGLKKKYGNGRERRTEIASFERVAAARVAIANETLYVNRAEGFAGWGMKKDEAVGECSRLDDVIVFCRDGTMKVVKVSEKAFVGKGVMHVAVFQKDDPVVYSMVYRDGASGRTLVKKFEVGGVTRDKDYQMSKGTPGTRVLFLAALTREAEDFKIRLHLKPAPRLRSLVIDFDFAELAIKGKGAKGNILTKHQVMRVARAPKE